MSVTTDVAEIPVLMPKQCATCSSGPTPELEEHTSPYGMTVRLPVCFSGHAYPITGQAVCRNVTRWEE